MPRLSWFGRVRSRVSSPLLIAVLLAASLATPQPAAAADANALVLVFSPATATAGVAKDFVLGATNGTGTLLTTYGGTVSFTSSDPAAILPVDYTYRPSDFGYHQFNSGVRFCTPGSQTISAHDVADGSRRGSAQVEVIPGAATHLSITTADVTPWVAGTGKDFTVQALDACGNVDTSYAGTIHFTATDGNPSVLLPPDYTFVEGDHGVHTFVHYYPNGVWLATAGPQTVTVTDTVSSSIGGSYAETVVAASTTSYGIQPSPTPWYSGASWDLTVTAFDPYGNVSTGSDRTIHFTTTDTRAAIPGQYTFVPGDHGVHTFPGVVMRTAGSMSLTVTDQYAYRGSRTFEVHAGSLARLTLSTTAPIWWAGASTPLTIRATDAAENTIGTYAGTVHVTSSDTHSVLPADVALGAGTATVNVSLRTAGPQTVVATDTADPSLTGTLGANVTASAAHTFRIEGFTAPWVAGTTKNVTITALDNYGNVDTMYGRTVHFQTAEDTQSVLPADYLFTPSFGSTVGDAGSHTFSITLKTAGAITLAVTDPEAAEMLSTATVTVTPAAATRLTLSIGAASVTAGTPQTVSIAALDAFGNRATGFRGTVHVTSTDPLAVLPGNYPFAAADAGIHAFAITLKTAGAQFVAATDVSSATIKGAQSAIAVLPAAAAALVVGAPSPMDAGTAATVTVEARDAFGNRATGYRGTVHFGSSDRAATLPGDHAFGAADAGLHSFSVTFASIGTQSLTATDRTATSISGTRSGIVVAYAAATYHPIAPARVLDTRPTNGLVKNIGLSGPFSAGAVRAFMVAGVPGVNMTVAAIPANAIAVTGNLTVVGQTASGIVSLGPTMTPSPDTTTLNFPASDIRANNVTLALGAGGSLSAVYLAPAGKTVQLIFDITGYFAAPTAAGGATYHSLPPGRVLDTRPTATGVTNIGLQGQFQNRVVRRFKVAGVKAVGWSTALVPANATAITGNLTVTRSTSGGFVAVGPTMTAYPATSTLNVPQGDNRANGVTVKLDGGYLAAVWAGTDGSRADVILDVTGYFTADATGAKYHPLTPVRLLNTQTARGLAGAFANRVPRSLAVTGHGGVPAGALGISGNVTIVGATSSGYVFLGPTASSAPTSSTVNTLTGDNRANGFDVSLSSTGAVGIVWAGAVGSSANVQLDVTGYWK